MKISAGLFLTDIMPHKRGVLYKIVKNNIFGTFPPAHVFKTLQKAGVDGIELFLPSFTKLPDKDFTALKKLLDENNVHVLSVHESLRFFSKTQISEIIRLFEIAKMLGAKVIVLHISLAGKQIFDAQYVKALHALEKKYGVMIGFENKEKVIVSGRRHPHHWDQVEFPLLVIKNGFHITFDTTHLAQAGGDIVTFFKKNKDKIINIHLSDYKHHFLNSTLRPFRYKHLPLGTGELPIKAFLALLHKENYKGLVTMEIHTDLRGMSESANTINIIRQIKKSS